MRRTAYQNIRDACQSGKVRLVLTDRDLNTLSFSKAIIERAKLDDEREEADGGNNERANQRDYESNARRVHP